MTAALLLILHNIYSIYFHPLSVGEGFVLTFSLQRVKQRRIVKIDVQRSFIFFEPSTRMLQPPRKVGVVFRWGKVSHAHRKRRRMKQCHSQNYVQRPSDPSMMTNSFHLLCRRKAIRHPRTWPINYASVD